MKGACPWSHLHDGLKHGNEDELDEADLSRGFGDFLSVHERSHRKSFSLLPVALTSQHMHNHNQNHIQNHIQSQIQNQTQNEDQIHRTPVFHENSVKTEEMVQKL